MFDKALAPVRDDVEAMLYQRVNPVPARLDMTLIADAAMTARGGASDQGLRSALQRVQSSAEAVSSTAEAGAGDLRDEAALLAAAVNDTANVCERLGYTVNYGRL
ncbi:MAG: hypothetical protein ACJ74O_07285 [Frankiaceae bacterium]